jgi:lauroyl/myristoyl acyltransferase
MRLISCQDLHLLLAFGLIRLTSWCGPLRRLTIGAAASAAYRLSRAKRRLTEKRLARALPDPCSAADRGRIVRSAFRAFWCDAFAISPSAMERAAVAQARIAGEEHLRRALEQGKGVILWESSAFGCRHLAKQVLHRRGLVLHQVHAHTHLGGFGGATRPPTWVRQRIIEVSFRRLESRFVDEIILLPQSDSLAFTRQLQHLLQQNQIICIAADGTTGQGHMDAPFLGGSFRFSTGMVSLARLTGAALLPIFCNKEPPGRLILTVEPALPMASAGGRDESTRNAIRLYASLMESYVRKHPGQYRSWHYP